MNRRNVLHLRSSLGFFGAENIIFQLSKGLSSYTSYRPIIGVINNTLNPHIEFAQVAQKHNLDTKVFECYGPVDIKTLSSIRDFVKRNDVGIIHAHGYKANFYALLTKLFENVPLVATCYPWNDASYSMKGKFYAWLDKQWLNRFHRIVTDSDEIREEILCNGISESKVSTIYNGIDVCRFEKVIDVDKLRNAFNIAPNRRVIGSVGRLTQEKGHHLLVEAAKGLVATFPNTIFMIVGDGEQRKKLQNRVLELGLQNHFLFTGIRNDIPEVLALMDIFVLPSLSEGLPMALLEAMAAKKPVVAANVGSISRVVTNKKTGILVPPNARDLEQAIAVLLKDKDRAGNLGREGYSRIVREFSPKRMAQKYAQIYDQVLNH